MCTQTCAAIDKIWEDGEGGMQFFAVVVGANETVEKLKASDERASALSKNEGKQQENANDPFLACKYTCWGKSQ